MFWSSLRAAMIVSNTGLSLAVRFSRFATTSAGRIMAGRAHLPNPSGGKRASNCLLCPSITTETF
jgi:hypothetical protein